MLVVDSDSKSYPSGVMAEIGNQQDYLSGQRNTTQRGAFRGFLYYLRLLLLALVLALIIKESLVEAYRIPSESMEDTLIPGDFLLANKALYGARIPFTDVKLPALREPQVGDIVVFRFPDDRRKNFIKRIVAAGGDTVAIANKDVFVNNKRLREDAYAVHYDRAVIPAGTAQPRDNFGPLAIPPGQYFVMGDNRDNSYDSRFWGCLPRDLIVGKAFLIHWSWASDEDTPPGRATKPLTFLSRIGYNIWHLPDHVRWKRLFRVIS